MSSGPYIIEHRRPAGMRKSYMSDKILYCEAFATLEEAQDCVAGPIAERLRASPQEAMDLASAVVRLAGPGTLTLPNGDVIEVEAVERQYAIWLSRSRNKDRSRDEWCVSWNAEHGIGIEAQA